MPPERFYILVQLWNLQYVTIVCLLIILCKAKSRKKTGSQSSRRLATSSEVLPVKLKEPSSFGNKDAANRKNPNEQPEEHQNEQKDNNTKKKENICARNEQTQGNIKEDGIKESAPKDGKERSKSQENESEKMLSLKKTQSPIEESPKRAFKYDENDKTKLPFDVKSMMEKGGQNKPNKAAISAIKSNKTTTAVEILPNPAMKDLSGIDDLPLPPADDENSTQPSVSIKMKDDDDTGENVEELKEDIEKSVDE